MIRNSYILDTDSVCVSWIGTNMDDLVRPELYADWTVEKSKWFVSNPDDAWELRLPGKMKLEWSTTNGAICA